MRLALFVKADFLWLSFFEPFSCHLGFCIPLCLHSSFASSKRVWIHPSLILILYGSLKPQRSFVQLFVWRPVKGVCLCPLRPSRYSFIPPSYISLFKPLPLSSHQPSILPPVCSLPHSFPNSPLICLSSPRSFTSSPFSLTLSCWEKDSAMSWQPSTRLPPGLKSKQGSTCSWGILMTSITLATLPAKLQAAWGKQRTLSEPV